MGKAPSFKRASSWLVLATSLALAVSALAGGCAKTTTNFEDDTNQSSTTSAQGGSGGASSQGGAGAGMPSPCGIDCSTIQAPQCQLAQCNTTTLQCEIVSDVDGGTCDDGVFCTADDTCQMGVCTGGDPNTCGMTPTACQSVTCNETNQNCSFASLMNGTACQSTDLCISGATCTNGLCIGGTPTDCFFFPVPNACHVAQCNPMNGLCQAVPGNNGLACTDAMDLCTVGKTCSMGTCQGGMPKDCSALTMGCFNGVCNTTNGQCIQQPVMPGGMCSSAADQCNNGICDTMGNCNPVPKTNGTTCNDQSFCSLVDTCQNGVCTGMSLITQCINADLCCPPGCTLVTDTDCNPIPNTRDAIHRGWWNESGSHTSTNNNTLTGRSSSLYNSYFIFALAGITGTVVAADLRLEIEAYTSVDASETLSVWDVTTPWATLEASGNSVAIYTDLMTGIQFGGFTVASTNVGQIMTIPLNASAVTAIQAGLGQNFSVGVHNDTVMGNTAQWVRFSAGSETRTHQLVVYTL